MANDQERINQLLHKIELLSQKQERFSMAINELRREANLLKASSSTVQEEVQQDVTPPSIAPLEVPKEEETISGYDKYLQNKAKEAEERTAPPKAKPVPKVKLNAEKFIGENLINKLGILITVIGVGIGAKYSIEHELISPLTRIILGYFAGLGLLGFGIKLKKKYESYSAVLVSGAMAIMYFITFAAYSFYGLIPQEMTFALMVVFTAFTVVAALNYNKQVIALIGLVGAYAVPFLLSDGSGKVAVLFSYMAIINVGILIIAFKKYWKPLYYSAFGLTWLIYSAWRVANYQTDDHFTLALVFLAIFFITFYVTFLAYKLLRKEKFEALDVVLTMANSFVFYGMGFSILSEHATGDEFLGLFTLCNAVIHFIPSVIIYRQKSADRKLFYLAMGMVMIFITIAVPVQLDGNWVTLLWAGEAALLFWIGRTKNVSMYEKLSYTLMLLAFGSIIHDWGMNYGNYYIEEPETRITPLLNINFLSSMLFVAAFGFINFLKFNKKFAQSTENKLSKTFSFIIPAIFLVTLYYAFRLEIETYWSQLFTDSALTIDVEGQDYPRYFSNYDLREFKTIWIINYSLLFLSILSFLNFKKLRNKELGIVNLVLNTVALLVFLTLGLYSLSELRDSYLNQTNAEYYNISQFNIGIRYVSFAFVAILLAVTGKFLKQDFLQNMLRIPAELFFHVTLLWIASSELISWMDMGGFSQSYKLGLSILWGCYSLLLISVGIGKKKKHLRIGAIALFAVTLLKLFFYDISHLDTIAKTIVFVSLGILLLIISFLYNKYKHLISDDEIED
ncbi:DUF2339 domain-containing protein [Flammeovirgaceae bacterium SG7u.111]|nr:DUF2339 domain-containing protein [Flammeovirgaceae bacterium SG7u.132]WPO33819.1 DUF2339 domain-containing protein [Flammeovirgaceae bacterium SG7u.111]